MKFVEERVLNFFLEKRIVATMRNGKYGLMIGDDVDILNGSGTPIGKAKVIAVLLNYPKFRQLLVKYSGFNNVKEWEQTAKKLHNGKLPKFIVLLRFTGSDTNMDVQETKGFEDVNEFIDEIIGEER
jgi:hypothetical protein